MATPSTKQAFRGQLAARAGQPEQATASEQAMAAGGGGSAAAAMARRYRGSWVQAPVTGPAAGNWRVTSDARGEAAAQPGKGPGDGIANTSPWPSRPILATPSRLLRRARTPGYENGRLIARDRHVAGYRGTTTSSDRPQATGGDPNPEADGPPRPSYRMLNRSLSWQIGTVDTRWLDNAAQKPVTSTSAGRAFPLGTQGDPYTRIYGGTPGLANFRAYGTRGGPGPGAPAPRAVAQPGGPWVPGTLLALGAPGDGPQKFPSGPPWGLTSATAPPVAWTNATQRFRWRQIRPPQQNRPLNSKVAGQSWDQQVVHLDGTQAVKVPTQTPRRQPGTNARWRH